MKLIPGEKNKIKKEIKKEEQKRGTRLTREDKRKIAKSEHKKMKRKVAIAGVLAAIGITGVMAHKQLPQPKETTVAKEDNRKDEFRENIKVDINELENKKDETQEEDIFKRIVNEYNNKYPDNTIQEEDLGIIESEPDFLIKQEDGENIKYIQNYKSENLESNQEYIHDNYCVNIDKEYIILNKKDETVILSQGMIDGKVVDIDSEIVRFNSKDYYKADNTIVLGESDADKVGIYNDLKRKFEERAQEKNQEDMEIE